MTGAEKVYPYYSEQEACSILATAETKFATIAFRQLYDQHFKVIYRVALKILDSSALAQDLTQEVFTTIWVKRAELARVNNFEAYLYTCARNLAYDHFKKKVRMEAVNEEYSLRLEVNHDPASIEKFNDALKLVAQLPPKARQVFELAKVEGLSYEAIAARLQISIITVNHHMIMALRLLKHRRREVSQ
jgi:RNA polymerase sigma-70 factor (ECF subfamily)